MVMAPPDKTFYLHGNDYMGPVALEVEETMRDEMYLPVVAVRPIPLVAGPADNGAILGEPLDPQLSGMPEASGVASRRITARAFLNWLMEGNDG